jgi:putative aldouronate transport system permease protein
MRMELAPRKRRVTENLDLYLMMVPMILFFLLIAYKPLTGLVIAFKYYSPFRGIWESDWVGFRYFIEFFSGPYAFRTIRNTFVVSLTLIVFGFPMPIILALLLNELRGGIFKKTVQTVSYVPHFISTVVVCGLVTNFLAPSTGLANLALKALGLESVYFLSIPSLFVPVFSTMEIWKSTGYNSIIYIAALSTINEELYEAAMIDGAGRWKQFLHVTLPCLMPTIIVMLLIRLGGILNVGYEAIILLYNPGIYETSDVISTYVYRSGLMEGRYDYATAVGLINSLVAFVIVVATNKVSNRMTGTGLW